MKNKVILLNKSNKSIHLTFLAAFSKPPKKQVISNVRSRKLMKKYLILLLILSTNHNFSFSYIFLAPPSISNIEFTYTKYDKFHAWVKDTKTAWDNFKSKWNQLLQSEKHERENIYNDLIELYDSSIKQISKIHLTGLNSQQEQCIKNCFFKKWVSINIIVQICRPNFKSYVLRSPNLINHPNINLITDQIDFIIKYLNEFTEFNQIISTIDNDNELVPDFIASKKKIKKDLTNHST